MRAGKRGTVMAMELGFEIVVAVDQHVKMMK